MLRPLAVAASLSLIARADVPELIPELLKLSPHQESWDKIMNDRIAAGLPVPELPPEREVSLEAATPEDILKVMRRERLLTSAWTPPIRPVNGDEAKPKDDKGPAITPEIRQKVLQAVQAEPTAIPKVLPYLPGDEASATAINLLLHLLPGETPEQKEDQRSVRAWIFLHSGLQRGEVLADAWHADWERYGGEGRKDPSLHAMQARDPQAFGPLLEMLASRGDPGLAVVAARLLLEQAKAGEGEQWRSQLMWAVLDPTTPKAARRMAVEALIFCYWPERDAWILSNLEQADPGEMEWYEKPVQDGRNHWIPTLIKCLKTGNPYARNHAAELLMSIHMKEQSPEILRALLPWLMDPAWAKTPGLSRLRLIQGFEKIDMPEAVPGLVHVVTSETEASDVAYAAESLAHQHAKAALSELKTALGRITSSHYRPILIKAIDNLDGFSPEEVSGALAAYYGSSKADRDSDAYLMDEASEDPLVDVGSYFDGLGKTTVAKFGSAIKALAATVEKDRPEVSRRLLELMLAGDGASSESIAKILSDGSITIHELDAALAHDRSSGGAWKTEDFSPLAAGPGATAGLAAVLTGDSGRIAAALKSPDPLTQAAVIAAARRTGDSLDLERVAELMASESPRVVAAASAYLKNSQNEKARHLWSSIRQPVDASRYPYKKLEELKKILSERLGYAARPTEIIGLETEFGGRFDGTYVVVYPDSALGVRVFGAGRVGTCPVTAEYLDLLRGYLAKYQVDDLLAYKPSIMDGVSYDYVHETPEGVRHFTINNPPVSRQDLQETLDRGTSRGVLIYYNLKNLLLDLVAAEDWNISYGPGIDVVIPAEASEILDVWKTGEELQVSARAPIRAERFRVDLKKKELSPAAPEEWPREALIAKLPRDFTTDNWQTSWQDKQGRGVIFGGKMRESKGLWLMRKDSELAFLAAGTFADELVSPDGKWCVASKADGDSWAKPNGVVRINLETREMAAIDLAPAEDLKAIAYLAPRKKFLIARSLPVQSDESKAGFEYHLVDPVTGTTELLDGDCQIFADYQAAQPTGARDEMWGAKSVDSPGEGTLVGRLNGQTLTFQPVWQIKGIDLDASTVWIDEKKETLYAAKNGDLLKIDLKGQKVPVPKK